VSAENWPAIRDTVVEAGLIMAEVLGGPNGCSKDEEEWVAFAAHLPARE